MSMKTEDYEEFQRQLELQNLTKENETKTKKDEDGTEYEWDEEKKAWFPKLSADLMLKYQSGYSDGSDASKDSTYFDPASKMKFIWDVAEHRWKPEAAQSAQYNYPDNYKYTDPKTGVVYTWDAKEMKWNASDSHLEGDNKEDGDVASKHISNATQEGVYVDPNSGIIYKWNQTKQVWESDDGHVLHPSNDWNAVQNYTDEQSGRSYTWDVKTQTWKEIAASGKGKGKKGKVAGAKRSASKPEWFNVENEKNTSVYVSGMPLDITKTEFLDIMSKCGIVAPKPLTNEPKLKLYLDDIGNPKGDGLCSYLKRESIALAKQLVDGMVLRDSTLKVQEAQFQLKGSYDASKKPKMLSKKEKKKLQKDQEKMLDWKLARAEETISKTDRVVILKNMFSVEEFEEDPVAITDIRDDLRKECEKFGNVKKVIVFDRHPDGVCSVAFKEVEAAALCQKALHGRWFAMKKIHAEVWDGVTDYQIEETDKEREVRLKKWEEFLVGEEAKSKDGDEADSTREESLDNSKCEATKDINEAADSKD